MVRQQPHNGHLFLFLWHTRARAGFCPCVVYPGCPLSQDSQGDPDWTEVGERLWRCAGSRCSVQGCLPREGARVGNNRVMFAQVSRICRFSHTYSVPYRSMIYSSMFSLCFSCIRLGGFFKTVFFIQYII